MTADDDSVIDWVVGGLSPEEAEPVRQRVEGDPRAALAAGETRALLEEMRRLRTEPSRRVEVALRHAVRRRAELRGLQRGPNAVRRELQVWSGILRSPAAIARMAAVAAVILTAMLFMARASTISTVDRHAATEVRVAVRVPRSPAPPSPMANLAVPSVEPVLQAAGPLLGRFYDELASSSEQDVFGRVVNAGNDLAVLRLEFVQRFSSEARLRSLRALGAPADLEDRIQTLAATVANELQGSLDKGDGQVVDVALALRALLASGSTPHRGHSEAVRAAIALLERRVADLEGGELASVLAALTDVAVGGSGEAAALVTAHAERLARSTLELPAPLMPHDGVADQVGGERARPPLLRFTTPVASLADAGHVLRLAPAFGVHPLLAHRARLLVAAHLAERLAVSSGDRPDVLAAQLYGFGDLVDREALDDRLRLWRPALLALDDFVALHHLLWSQYPVRPGWARFQCALRELATLATPAQMADASALLLSLTMNFAAPGVHEVLQLAG